MDKNINDGFRGLIRNFRIPIPDNLEILFGYRGKQRFIAIWFELELCQLCFSDGKNVDTNGFWSSWYSYITHPKMRVYFKQFNMGIEASYPDHFIVLDRKKRALYIGKESLVMDFVDKNEAISFNQIDNDGIAHPLDHGSPLECMQNWLEGLNNKNTEVLEKKQ